MAEKFEKNAVITSVVKETDGIYSMWLKDSDIAIAA